MTCRKPMTICSSRCGRDGRSSTTRTISSGSTVCSKPGASDKGLAYFRRLAAQDQIFQRGARGRISLVAAGEAPLTIGYGPHAQSFVNQGAPIDWVPLEPVVVIINTASIAARPPHPAAAKLFIDFLFSKPAQLKLREMSRIPSRSDVEADPPRLIERIQKSRSGFGERKHGGVDQTVSTDLRSDGGMN